MEKGSELGDSLADFGDSIKDKLRRSAVNTES
jgi:hypothetical protein